MLFAWVQEWQLPHIFTTTCFGFMWWHHEAYLKVCNIFEGCVFSSEFTVSCLISALSYLYTLQDGSKVTPCRTCSHRSKVLTMYGVLERLQTTRQSLFQSSLHVLCFSVLGMSHGISIALTALSSIFRWPSFDPCTVCKQTCCYLLFEYSRLPLNQPAVLFKMCLNHPEGQINKLKPF